jgi:hypothetical protein
MPISHQELPSDQKLDNSQCNDMTLFRRYLNALGAEGGSGVGSPLRARSNDFSARRWNHQLVNCVC